jgi:hypothetical protein
MIKLPRLPERSPVKISISVSPELNDCLRSYARLYLETYGADEPLVELIPAMLVAFLESDRAFAKAKRGGNVAPG